MSTAPAVEIRDRQYRLQRRPRAVFAPRIAIAEPVRPRYSPDATVAGGCPAGQPWSPPPGGRSCPTVPAEAGWGPATATDGSPDERMGYHHRRIAYRSRTGVRPPAGARRTTTRAVRRPSSSCPIAPRRPAFSRDPDLVGSTVRLRPPANPVRYGRAAEGTAGRGRSGGPTPVDQLRILAGRVRGLARPPTTSTSTPSTSSCRGVIQVLPFRVVFGPATHTIVAICLVVDVVPGALCRLDTALDNGGPVPVDRHPDRHQVNGTPVIRPTAVCLRGSRSRRGSERCSSPPRGSPGVRPSGRVVG